MTAGDRTEAAKAAPLPHRPRPLGAEARGRRRTGHGEPEMIERGAMRLDDRARGRIMVIVIAALVILPGIAGA